MTETNIILLIIFALIIFVIIGVGFVEQNLKLMLGLLAIAIIAIGGFWFFNLRKPIEQPSNNITVNMTSNVKPDKDAKTKSISKNEVIRYDEFLEKQVASSTNNKDKNKNSKEDIDTSKTGFIFIGDSRFIGMNLACKFDESQNQFIIAKDGSSYYWASNECYDEIHKITTEHSEFEYWTIITGFGINDLADIGKYLDLYNDLSAQYNIVLVSVNPVEYHSSITNNMIEAFNAELSTCDYTYIDTYSVLMEKGFKTVDGLHYTNETYEVIYDEISKNLNL